MKTETAILKQDFTIEKGTVIPGLDPYDAPIVWTRTYKAGTSIVKCDIFPDHTVELKEDGNYLHSPNARIITNYIWQNAVLPQGCDIKVEEDGRKIYKMFQGSLAEGNFVTQFLSNSIEEAIEEAKKWILTSNLPLDFTYAIRS